MGGGSGGGQGEIFGVLTAQEGLQGIAAHGVISTVQDGTPGSIVSNTGFEVVTRTAVGGATVGISSPYAARCPEDRAITAISVFNASTAKRVVSVSGGMRVGSGSDGACKQSYASLGVAVGKVLASFGVSSLSTGATSLADGKIELAPGASVLLEAGGGIAGGQGEVYGSVTHDGQLGDVVVQGATQVVQDSAASTGASNLEAINQY